MAEPAYFHADAHPKRREEAIALGQVLETMAVNAIKAEGTKATIDPALRDGGNAGEEFRGVVYSLLRTQGKAARQQIEHGDRPAQSHDPPNFVRRKATGLGTSLGF